MMTSETALNSLNLRPATRDTLLTSAHFRISDFKDKFYSQLTYDLNEIKSDHSHLNINPAKVVSLSSSHRGFYIKLQKNVIRKAQIHDVSLR
ncbi:hypothetical protein AVEN_75321-1 [Araneus ventricosus]|uniref:Uncharacterized protein n=1 Tax=Araneus ventricosus TaxID=182803 RepID=A0A4Y2G5K4_ARAVE|nr:hypothetical protein AVEN_75321-1 [Araneus ventricosus]